MDAAAPGSSHTRSLKLRDLVEQAPEQPAQARAQVLLGIFNYLKEVVAEMCGAAAKVMPRSSKNPRISLISAVRRCTSRSERGAWLAHRAALQS
jgi:hypothetical protein